MSLHAQDCPDLTGKFLCGKGGKFTAEIESTSATSYRVQGPFDLPEHVHANGRRVVDPVTEVEYYTARCDRGRLIVELLTLREDERPGGNQEASAAAQPAVPQGERPKTIHLHVLDVYSKLPDGTVERQRHSTSVSDKEAKSKMYCVPQR